MLEDARSVITTSIVCKAVFRSTNIRVTKTKVRNIMRKDFQLSYIKTKKLHPAANTANVMVQRQ